MNPEAVGRRRRSGVPVACSWGGGAGGNRRRGSSRRYRQRYLIARGGDLVLPCPLQIHHHPRKRRIGLICNSRSCSENTRKGKQGITNFFLRIA